MRKPYNHLLGHIMNTTKIVLDHQEGITLDPSNSPFSNYQAFQQTYDGLKLLADIVRDLELKASADDPYAAQSITLMPRSAPPVLGSIFNWFSVTIVNYLRLIALVDLMAKNNWQSGALANPSNLDEIKKHCGAYVLNVIPEIQRWRNKVVAHFAATDPRFTAKDSDTLATLELSIMNPISYKNLYYFVGTVQWNTQGTSSDLPEWSLTETYERLGQRFWPQMRLRNFSNVAQPIIAPDAAP